MKWKKEAVVLPFKMTWAMPVWRHIHNSEHTCTEMATHWLLPISLEVFTLGMLQHMDDLWELSEDGPAMTFPTV